MVGLWGDSEEGEEEEGEGEASDSDSDSDGDEEEEGRVWAPGPMARVPFKNARLTWPRRLGAAGDWGLKKGEEEEDERRPITFLKTCDAASGLLVLPRGAWRPIGEGPAAAGAVPASSSSSSGPSSRSRGGAKEEGDGDGGALSFSPKATYRFVLQDAGEVGAEMEALLLLSAAAALGGGGGGGGSESEGE